jgi:chromate transporter
LAAASLRIGCLGFGGPAGQIALMHRVFVDEKRWIDEPRYLHALNYCMLLPGPEAQQLATYAGWTLHGVRGGLIAGLLFVLPGAVFMFGLSWAYVLHADTPLAAAVLWGVKAAVLALIVDALVRIGKRALRGVAALLIAAAAFAALFLFGLPFPLVIIAAGLLGLLMAPSGAETPAPAHRASVGSALGAALTWGAIWIAPPLTALVLLGRGHVLSEIGVFFSQLSIVTFGGAYAVLAYLQQQAVDTYAWLAPEQMIDGLGLAETTPGPLILVNQFVGFIAGWNDAEGGLGLAAACALMASWCTFAPSFVWIFAGAPFAERLRGDRHAAGALAAITAAVLGVIANMAVWFAVHVLFHDMGEIALPWARTLSVPVFATVDLPALALAALAAIALVRFKANVVLIVVACAAAGLARSLL